MQAARHRPGRPRRLRGTRDWRPRAARPRGPGHQQRHESDRRSERHCSLVTSTPANEFGATSMDIAHEAASPSSSSPRAWGVVSLAGRAAAAAGADRSRQRLRARHRSRAPPRWTAIRALQAASGDVVVVATVPTVAPYADIREYAVKLFENHGRGIGEKGKDNGLLILLAVKERKVWIEVGYDLEQWITDGFAGETSREVHGAANSASGRYGDGLLAGVARASSAASRRAAASRCRACRAGAGRAAQAGSSIPVGLILILVHHPAASAGSAAAARRRRAGAAAGGAAGTSGVGPFGGGRRRFGGGGGRWRIRRRVRRVWRRTSGGGGGGASW